MIFRGETTYFNKEEAIKRIKILKYNKRLIYGIDVFVITEDKTIQIIQYDLGLDNETVNIWEKLIATIDKYTDDFFFEIVE